MLVRRNRSFQNLKLTLVACGTRDDGYYQFDRISLTLTGSCYPFKRKVYVQAEL